MCRERKDGGLEVVGFLLSFYEVLWQRDSLWKSNKGPFVWQDCLGSLPFSDVLGKADLFIHMMCVHVCKQKHEDNFQESVLPAVKWAWVSVPRLGGTQALSSYVC